MATTQSATQEDHAKTLAKLPDGLLAKALAFLDPPSLFAAAQVSHKWNSLASDDNIWEKYVHYVTVPPTGAWKPKGKKTPEPDERRDDDEKEEKEQKGDKEKEKKEPQKWDGSKALLWLRQQTDEGRARVLGGISYEVEPLKDQDIAKRKNKEIFRQHAGRGWYLPGYNCATKSDGARVQLATGKGNDEKFKLVVDNKPLFRVATQSSTSGFYFERLLGKDASYDVSNDFEKSLKGLGGALGMQEKLRKGGLRVDTKTLNTLASLLPSGKYDVACVQVWPQLMKCGTNEHPETGTKGDYWRHEWTKEGWGCTGVPENERYYRCWTHTRLLNWPINEGKLPGLDAIFSAFVIPLQHEGVLDRALVDEYKREWQNDPAYLPTAVAVGAWDQRNVSSSYDNPLIRVTSGVHLLNFLIDGHHKIQAAAELGKPISLLTFVVADRFSENKHEVALRLANTRYAQPAPKREPIKIVSHLPPLSSADHLSLYVRLGYCVNANAVEIADLLKKDNVRPKRVVVSQDTWQILVQLHDNDLITFHNLFTVTSSSATAPIYDEHSNGDEAASSSPAASGEHAAAGEGQQDAGAATAEGGEKAATTGEQAATGNDAKEGDSKAEAPAKPSQEPAKGQQAPSAKGGAAPAAKPKPGASKGGAPGGKTRGSGKGGKPGRGGAGGKGGRGGKSGGGGGGGRKGDDENDEEHTVASIAARGRPKWLYLKNISSIGYSVIQPKVPIDEDLEEFNTWDERDLSIWTYNRKRSAGGGGALGNRGPRRNQWRENGGQSGGGQGGWRGNENAGRGRNFRGQGGRKTGGGGGGGMGGVAPGPGGGYLGGPGPIGMNPMSPYVNPGVVGPVGFVGAGPMSGAPRGRGPRPQRGGGRGGGRGRFVNPGYYPKFARPVVFAQELPQELANIQGIPLQPSNMIYINNPGPGFPALGGEKLMQDPGLGGPVPVGAPGVPVSMGGPGLGGPGLAQMPGQQPQQPVRTGGGGLCHFFFNTTVGCRYGEHCWFSHSLEFQQN